jgi:LPXTG-site transpeptidase (sortase) family protein
VPDASSRDRRAPSEGDSTQDELNPSQPVDTLPEGADGAAGNPDRGERHRHRHHRRRFSPIRTIAVGGVVIVAALLLATQFNWSPGPQASLAEASPSGASPSGASPSAALSSLSILVGSGSDFPGSPTPAASPHPVKANRITISRLAIDLRVVDGDGLDAPLGAAAHYPGTSWPGGGSNIYLYAHARDGMFIKLWDAQVGDEVVLTLVDGSQRRYVVSEIRPKVVWNDMSVLAPTPTEQLTLQTCTSYQQTAPRFLVIAIPEQ